MRKIAIVLGLAVAFSAWAPPLHAGDDVIDSVLEVAEVEIDAKTVRVRINGPAILVALAARAPDIETLALDHPSSAYDVEVVAALGRFPKLRSLTMSGDMFMYDLDFAVLGRMSGLRELHLSLP